MPDLPMRPIEMQWCENVPRSIARHTLFGIALMIAAFGGFGAWAFFAPLAAAVITQGSFVATGQNKIVQHLEGGIIKSILVQEGDTVKEGQTLLQLDETSAEADQRELHLRQVRLEATAARLQAQYRQHDDFAMPAHLLAERSDPEIGPILGGQQLAFEVSMSGLNDDIALLEGNIEAMTIRAGGYSAQLASLRSQRALLADEFAAKQTLHTKGLVRKPELNALERARVEAEGEIARLQAEIAETEVLRGKYETQMERAYSEHRQAALEELQAIQAELESVREKARKARNVLRRVEVAAPVTGTVVRLYYHTPGGVIESGKAIAEILPAGAPLIIEAQIPRKQIDSVHRGQAAKVRLTALNRRTTPVLDGEVYYVSADAVAKGSNGAVRDVYVARVALSRAQLRRVQGFRPTPGMPAEIMIQTAERTFAQYIAKPIKDSMSRAFRER